MLPDKVRMNVLNGHSNEGTSISIEGGRAKDRYVHIPQELIHILRIYYRKYRPTTYLFNGRKKGSKMSVSSLRWLFTMPREIQSLSRSNPSEIYNCLMRSAWQSLKNT